MNKKYETGLGLCYIVRAKMQIVEGGGDVTGDPNAPFIDPTTKRPVRNYIHANPGDFGTVESIDDGVATVRFYPKGTATIVGDGEVEVYAPTT